MQDNVDLCKLRLHKNNPDYIKIVDNNIICADSLTYKFTDRLFEINT